MCQNVLKDGYNFLRIFQSKDIKIHLLIEAFYSHLKNVLVDICEPAGLRKSKGCPLGGLELKVLVLETTVERQTRKENEKYEDTTKNKTDVYVRHCLLLEVEQILLGHELRNNLKKLFDRNDVDKKDQEKILKKAKEIKRNFLIEPA